MIAVHMNLNEWGVAVTREFFRVRPCPCTYFGMIAGRRGRKENSSGRPAPALAVAGVKASLSPSERELARVRAASVSLPPVSVGPLRTAKRGHRPVENLRGAPESSDGAWGGSNLTGGVRGGNRRPPSPFGFRPVDSFFPTPSPVKRKNYKSIDPNTRGRRAREGLPLPRFRWSL